jgi:hypothetical protein
MVRLGRGSDFYWEGCRFDPAGHYQPPCLQHQLVGELLVTRNAADQHALVPAVFSAWAPLVVADVQAYELRGQSGG